MATRLDHANLNPLDRETKAALVAALSISRCTAPDYSRGRVQRPLLGRRRFIGM